MTDSEEQDLLALANALAEAETSPWQPSCICAAFARSPGRLVLTMQGWIDLEAARSPLLEGKPIDADDADGQLTAAVNAFDLGELLTEPEDRDALVEAMLEAVVRAFSTRIAMCDPGKTGGSSTADGFGEWLPIYTCLTEQMGKSEERAMAYPVAQAFAVIAGHRHNQGLQVVGMTYAQRDIEFSHEEEASR